MRPHDCSKSFPLRFAAAATTCSNSSAGVNVPSHKTASASIVIVCLSFYVTLNPPALIHTPRDTAVLFGRGTQGCRRTGSHMSLGTAGLYGKPGAAGVQTFAAAYEFGGEANQKFSTMSMPRRCLPCRLLPKPIHDPPGNSRCVLKRRPCCVMAPKGEARSIQAHSFKAECGQPLIMSHCGAAHILRPSPTTIKEGKGFGGRSRCFGVSGPWAAPGPHRYATKTSVPAAPG
jgi:hypothetical protein